MRIRAGLLAFVLAFNVWTNLAFLWPLQPNERARRGAVIAVRDALTTHLRSFTGDTLLVEVFR